MLIVTSENLPGYKITEVKGKAFGLVVRSRGLVPNIFAEIRSLFGGEIYEYTSMLENARSAAIDRMVVNAKKLGANAIIMFRFDSGSIGNKSEVIAYGTAVVALKSD